MQDYEQKISVMTSNSRKTIVAEDLLISSSAANWDEYDGKLYELTAALYKNDLQSSESEINQKEDEKTVSFGIRTFGDDGYGHLSLNGRRIFLRSEANCAEFPETGYIQWKRKRGRIFYRHIKIMASIWCVFIRIVRQRQHFCS